MPVGGWIWAIQGPYMGNVGTTPVLDRGDRGIKRGRTCTMGTPADPNMESVTRKTP